jgi:hypothetical protein
MQERECIVHRVAYLLTNGPSKYSLACPPDEIEMLEGDVGLDKLQFVILFCIKMFQKQLRATQDTTHHSLRGVWSPDLFLMLIWPMTSNPVERI